MQLDYTKTTGAALWVVAMYAVGLVMGVRSLIGWTVLAGLAVAPPLVMGRRSIGQVLGWLERHRHDYVARPIR